MVPEQWNQRHYQPPGGTLQAQAYAGPSTAIDIRGPWSVAAGAYGTLSGAKMAELKSAARMLNAKLREIVPQSNWRRYGVSTPRSTPVVRKPTFGSPLQKGSGGSPEMVGKASFQWSEELLDRLNPIATSDEIDEKVAALSRNGITFLGPFRQEDRAWERVMRALEVRDDWGQIDLQSSAITRGQALGLMSMLDDSMDALTFMTAVCAGKVILEVDSRITSTSPSVCMRYLSVTPDDVIGNNPFTRNLNEWMSENANNFLRVSASQLEFRDRKLRAYFLKCFPKLEDYMSSMHGEDGYTALDVFLTVLAICHTKEVADAQMVATQQVFLEEPLEYMNWLQFQAFWKKNPSRRIRTTTMAGTFTTIT